MTRMVYGVVGLRRPVYPITFPDDFWVSVEVNPLLWVVSETELLLIYYDERGIGSMTSDP